MGTTPTTFTGTSQYAADLKQAITHAVDIASVPLNQLNRDVTKLQGQFTELGNIESKFAAVQTAIQSLTSAVGTNGLTASVADPAVVSVTLDPTEAATAGSYSVNVIHAGTPASTLSDNTLPTVANPSTTSFSSSTSFQLTVDGSTFTINPPANTLNSLVQAINSSGAGVNATLVNVGSPSAPDYRLSLQNTRLGDVAIQLNDQPDGTGLDLLSPLITGSLAQYQVDGLASTISSDTDTVILAPGLTVNLRQTGITSITVSQNSFAAANALSSFVAAYNAASSELSQNRGITAGALSGQSIVFTLQQSLKDITSYAGGSGAVENLTDLGLTFDSAGKLSFNQSQFSTVASAHPSDLAAFLGSPTGSGFLSTASNILIALGDPVTGTLTHAISSVQDQVTQDTQKIVATQNQIDAVQKRMEAQMSQADALIASLQSQVTYFTTLFEDIQNALKIGR